MKDNHFKENFLNKILNPKIIINDIPIDDPMRTENQLMYPTIDGRTIRDEPIGWSHKVHFRTGSI